VKSMQQSILSRIQFIHIFGLVSFSPDPFLSFNYTSIGFTSVSADEDQ
jgi:hypothetical protein